MAAAIEIYQGFENKVFFAFDILRNEGNKVLCKSKWVNLPKQT